MTGPALSLLAPIGDDDWMTDAACRDHPNPDLWFPELVPPGPGAVAYDHEAKRICAECPVRAACRDFAVVNKIDHGMWGGLNPNQRRRRRAA